MSVITDEIKTLFKQTREQLGAGITSVELTDEQLCSLLDISIEDYLERTQNAIIDNNWISLYGKNRLNATELSYAFNMRTFDMAKDYSDWFSARVGLQQHGKWELKKDFITIEKGKQLYVVPAGRVINKVMYVTPPTTDMALFANYGGLGFGVGMAGNAGMGSAYMGSMMGGFYTMQSADIAYVAADLKFKNSIIRGDLTYKVTAGPEGTHFIHLLSTPGSKMSFSHFGYDAGSYGLIGCSVWYTYYDVGSDDEATECMIENADNVILSPDQVPMNRVQYAFLNDPAKVIVRQLFVAKAKMTLGLIRGKFNGKVNVPMAELSMDYQMLIQQGTKEWDATMDRLDKRLERLRPANVLEENAKLVEQNKTIMSKTPLGIYVI